MAGAYCVKEKGKYTAPGVTVRDIIDDVHGSLIALLFFFRSGSMI